MQINIALSDRESRFLTAMSSELAAFKKREITIEEAIHECINMAMYDESEETAQEEGM